MRTVFAGVLAAAFVATAVAQAAPITSPSAFSGSETVIDFSGLAADQLVDVEYTALGVTFSGGLFAVPSGYGGFFPAASGGAAGANHDGFSCPCGDVTATFDPPVRRAGMWIVTNPGDDTTLKAYKDGVLLESQTFDTTTVAAMFIGIDSATPFDTLVIDITTNVNQAAAFDDFTFEVGNEAPDCSSAAPSESQLWPPDHRMVSVSIGGVTDPDGDVVTIAITSIRQDEPTNAAGDGNTAPDGAGVGTSAAQVRAERSGKGDGRVYHIGFTADDGNGGTCSGVVRTSVPHNQGKHGSAVDGGALFDSTS